MSASAVVSSERGELDHLVHPHFAERERGPEVQPDDAAHVVGVLLVPGQVQPVALALIPPDRLRLVIAVLHPGNVRQPEQRPMAERSPPIARIMKKQIVTTTQRIGIVQSTLFTMNSHAFESARLFSRLPRHLLHAPFSASYARPFCHPSAFASPGCSARAVRSRSRSRARSVTGPRRAVPPVE